jgi:galactokinase
LTADYAAIPVEMKQAAACFGKEYLRQVSREELFAGLSKVRERAGDRAALRAIHFVEEDERVRQEVAALSENDFSAFLQTVKASGDSSFKYLQNVYTSHDVQHQNMSLALALSDSLLGENGVSRVHGGGFAGTIQAFVKNEAVADYKKGMDNMFGEGSCSVLKIRKYGGMKVL